jgi:glycosyltransferase involved in cell wall biosynthesis
MQSLREKTPVPILVATILPGYGATGVHTHFNELVRYLRSEHRAVSIVSAPTSSLVTFPSRVLRKLASYVFPEVGVWWRYAVDGTLLRMQLRQHLRKAQPVVIYAQCPIAAAAALKARKRTSQKVVLIVHFNISSAHEWEQAGQIKKNGPMWRLAMQRDDAVMTQVDALVYVSNFMLHEIERRIPACKRVANVLIPNFVHAPTSSKTTTMKPTDLVSIGTLEYRKNQIYALEILACLHERGLRLSLTLIGAGIDREKLEQAAHALGLTEYVQFAGFVPKASEYLAMFGAYLHVARMENFPLVLVEALAHGLPVFAPDVGGTAEVFSDGIDGWVIPLSDASGAAGIIETCMKDEDRMRQAAIAAKRHFLECYETRNLARRLFEYMQDVSSSPQKTARLPC